MFLFVLQIDCLAPVLGGKKKKSGANCGDGDGWESSNAFDREDRTAEGV